MDTCRRDFCIWTNSREVYICFEQDPGSDVLVGLIYHTTKLKPPAQIQKYCGFLYDYEGIPKLRLPDNKVARDLARLWFLTRGSRTIL
jgi:hypothetical protein